MPTLLCVPIMVQDEVSALADAAAARDAGAELVEFRVDEVFSGALNAHGELDDREVGTILRIVAGSVLPCIVTCRHASEGGKYDGDDAARIALYERLGTAGGGGAGSGKSVGSVPGEHPPKYLDIEFASYTRSANLKQKVNLAVDHPGQQRDVRTGLILSLHDFQGRPGDLLRRVGAMQEEPAARIIKVAFHARSIRDNLECFDLLTDNAAGGAGEKLMIALAMGRFGLMSRVLAPKFGGFLTFASLRKQSTTAPGQPTVGELLNTYRFRSINAKTRVYGVIGDPVEHSMSPLVHNAGFEAISSDSWNEKNEAEGDERGGFDGVYLPLPVPKEYEHFKASLSALIDHPRLDFCGCSVTIPHKQHLVRFARERMDGGDDHPWEVDELSLACGAANTLVISRDRLGLPMGARVMNTDAAAAVECLRGPLGLTPTDNFAGKRIVLIGAGGVARAIAAGLLDAGASVVIVNRTRANAEAVAAELGASGLAKNGGNIAAAEMADLARRRCDALVNCTPIGMAGGPAPKESPISVEDLRPSSPDAVVMDTVYNPVSTPLLEQAALAGFRTIDGVQMFVRQAGMQFQVWTRRPAPVRLFDRVCREALGTRGGG